MTAEIVLPLQRLAELGQSVWIDYLSRDLLENGRLAHLVRDDAVVGVTSNPTIFQQAISRGHAYDEPTLSRSCSPSWMRSRRHSWRERGGRDDVDHDQRLRADRSPSGGSVSCGRMSWLNNRNRAGQI